MNKYELILKGISDGDTIGGPYAIASLVVKTLANDPFDLGALDRAYRGYYLGGSFDSGPTFEKVHELLALGETREQAVKNVHKAHRGFTAGCNPMHRFVVVAGLDIPYRTLDDLARKDATLTHFDPIAGLISSVTVRIIRKVLENYSLTEAMRSVTNELNVAERKILQTTPSPSGYAPAVLNAAVQFSQDPNRGLIRAIEYAGSNNYCPPIVGAFTRCIKSDLTD